MTTSLQKAAQAVLDRWNSPKWEWHKQGPTGELMADLYAAITPPPEVYVPDTMDFACVALSVEPALRDHRGEIVDVLCDEAFARAIEAAHNIKATP